MSDRVRHRREAQAAAQQARRVRERVEPSSETDELTTIQRSRQRREAKTAAQRSRRARQRALDVANTERGPSRLEREPPRPPQKATEESLRRRRQAQREKVAARRQRDQERLEALRERVLSTKTFSKEEINWMQEGQRFTRDPELALAFFHCTGPDPGSFIFGDEELLSSGTDVGADEELLSGGTGDGEERREEQCRDTIVGRMTELLNDIPNPENVAKCQQDVRKSASEATAISACASCGRILLKNIDSGGFFKPLSQLQDLLLSEGERSKLFDRAARCDVEKYRQVFFDGDDMYFLIPELVRDLEKIPLCEKCYKDPRANKFSVVSGNDYGRIGQLPELSAVALACISPVRCFGLELSLSGKKLSGHAICFPSNGPCQMVEKLPTIGIDVMPRVTFVGANEEWRIQKHNFRKLYAINEHHVFEWLHVLSAVNDIFHEEDITIDESPHRRQQLRDMEEAIDASVHVSDSAIAASIQDEADAVDQADQCEPNVSLRQSAVLPHVQRSVGTPHGIIDAVITAVGGLVHGNSIDDTQQTANSEESFHHHAQRTPVIPIKRGSTPFVEWNENAKLLAGIFPNLFLAGASPLPSGPLPQSYVNHFMHYWDGRFEQSVTFVALLFNQLQRHAAVLKAARVGTTHEQTMKRFGRLASTPAFRRVLQEASDNPETPRAGRLNAALLRLLSLVGSCVPFSPFERATTRPKLGAMRFRYGVAQHFVTIAPPEHDDLLLLRLARLRATGAWNDESNICSSSTCTFSDLPLELQQSARARLLVANKYPALTAQLFERRMHSLLHDVLRCRESRNTRISRSYIDRECGAYGKLAAFNAVIEPQSDGRLHAHLMLYGSSINPSLLSRLACCRQLFPNVRKWLDSVSTTVISETTRRWFDEWLADHDGKAARAFEIPVPDIRCSVEDFLEAAQKRVLSTNTHTHSQTCRKGYRGRYACRLARPAGVHELETQPLLIKMKKRSELGKRTRAEFEVNEVTEDVARDIDLKHNYASKRLLREHKDGAIVWEQYRPMSDTMFVETNLYMACLSSSHTNSAIINGSDSGDMVEEYQQAYMTKEGGGLKHGAAVVLTALNDIERFPSVADDAGTDLRSAKYLATRTVNSFTGAHEWSHTVMVYALDGHTSHLSSDTFWFVFPHSFAKHAKRYQSNADTTDRTENQGQEEQDYDSDDSGSEQEDSEAESDTGIESEDDVYKSLEKLAFSTNANNSQRQSGESSTGAQICKINDRIILVTQAESYHHRGAHFGHYSPLEFFAIVDVQPRPPEEENAEVHPGRPRRFGFDLGDDHPLTPHYQAFIRAKFRTPMLGGSPPPSLSKTGEPSAVLSAYLLSLVHPWVVEAGVCSLNLSPETLLRVCEQWNSSSAPFLARQRYRYLINIVEKLFRSSKNEATCSEWRTRNADFWNTCPEAAQTEPPTDGHRVRVHEDDTVSTEEIFQLMVAASAKDHVAIQAAKSMRASFWALIPDTERGRTVYGTRSKPPLYSHHIEVQTDLGQMARRIHMMAPKRETESIPTATIDIERRTRGTKPLDPLSGQPTADEDDRQRYTPDQRAVFDHIAQSMGGNGRLNQTLNVIHGGGGTGKSTLIKGISTMLKRNGILTVHTCPTGVGASHLENGRTFHSALKAMNTEDLSVNDLELLRLTFTDQVWMVVVDEVSMLSAEFLALLDSRLQEIYSNTSKFGGRSIILAGDFLQLDVTHGTPLCKMLYTTARSSVIVAAKALFQAFRVHFLTHQHRAAECSIQQSNLNALRMLPSFYPEGMRYTENEAAAYQPVSRDVIKSITQELTLQDVESDHGWLDDMTILVTSNFDKAVLTQCATRLYGHRHTELVFRWKRHVKQDLTPELRRLIYDEDANPELFAYFVAGAPAHILDNNNGNVGWSIANGTKCKLHSLAWNDAEKTSAIRRLSEQALREQQEIVDLPFPPDFVNVQLISFDGSLRSAADWPPENNLDARTQASIIIPIGLMNSKGSKQVIKLGQGVLSSHQKISYVQHAVDVAFVMTVWKAQGSTLKRVLLSLESTQQHAPAWKFEHIYVGLSRVTAAKYLRCLPLSGAFRRSKLLRLRPNICVTRWRLDSLKRLREGPTEPQLRRRTGA